MRWRSIGPFRGGRGVPIAGIPTQPNVFYFAASNGGVWRSTDYGRVWTPLFDEQPIGSIGSMAIAPSDPNVIYVGSGEGLHRPDLSVGNGMYRSSDGGRTWTHLGLDDAQQIGSILVDPRDANRLFVAALGHPYGPNPERGVFLSTDGGRSWKKALYKDENTGAIDLAFAPGNPSVVYAALWSAREGPWENGEWNGQGSGLFRSSDGGEHWTQVTGGLPTVEQGLGRIGFTISPSDPKRMYAMVDAKPEVGGVYRSDDAGTSWTRVNHEERVWGRGSDFAWVRVDPRNSDLIYVANTSTYKSTDGGKTFRPWKGAPGGDDYHSIWINPNQPDIIFLGSDQGATITVNGGQTWSSWYNQPTAQMYHVTADNQFPYWVYGGQQESGSAGVASRGNNGAITYRDWKPVGAEEYAYVAPDPLHPNIIYGDKVTRHDMITGQTEEVGPQISRGGNYRFLRTVPLLFSPVDQRQLFLSGNVVFKTGNGGQTWDVISPDLTRKTYDLPASLGIFSNDAKKEATQRGVIYALALSYKNVNTIWAGTDDGLIHLTRDGGKNWKDITPPQLTAWSKVSTLDASRFDDNTVYAAINRIRLDDMRAHILRTHDGGKTWQEIVKGLPDDPINVVREDPVRKGLLYAGSERAVYVSNDDGENWQTLRLNMPATSVRDLTLHGDDLIAATHGRGFWILDDVTPLRQAGPEVSQADAFLFTPQMSYRVRRDVYTDTPPPPEEPAGQNPPDGAIIDYYLKPGTGGPVTLEVLDSRGQVVRAYSSNDQPDFTEEQLNRTLTVPVYWVRFPRILPATPGMHRFVWDLRYAPPRAEDYGYPIGAIYHDTPREPSGVLVLPGVYTVRLTVGGKSFTKPLQIKMDPRVSAQEAALRLQFDTATKLSRGITDTYLALEELKKARGSATDGAVKTRISEILEGKGREQPGMARVHRELIQLYENVLRADAAPNAAALREASEAESRSTALLTRWSQFKAQAK